MLYLALPCHKIRPIQLNCLISSVGRALSLESRGSWVGIPPVTANFSLKETSSGAIDLCCATLCTCLEDVPIV